MSVNLINEIILIFLQRDIKELSDTDLSTTIETKGNVCSIEEIHYVVQSSGSSLFQVRLNREGTFLICIKPKINICQDFLAGQCVPKPGGCNQLHICHFFGGHCRKKACRSPHDLHGRNNQRIIQHSNCRHVDPFLLVPLIQLYNRSSQHTSQNLRTVVSASGDATSSSVQPKHAERVFQRTKRFRRRQGSPGETSDKTVNRENSVQSSSSCQVDISFPTTSSASSITIETIEAFLRREGLSIQQSFNLKTNENFHRWTLQLEDNDAANDLLTRSVIPHQGFHLKFKRTISTIDPKCFILKLTMDVRKGPVAREKFSSYIDILINRSPYTLTDLSTASEQILLVECNKMIDFGELRRIQKSRRQVQGRDVCLKQVLEIETVIIESLSTSLSSASIQNIIASADETVFIFTIISNQEVCVEFIHADALRQWRADSYLIEQKFNVKIKPNIECVDGDDRDNVSRRSSTAQSVKPKENNRTSQTIIYIRRQWVLVVEHPEFSVEYKNYIRSETGFEIDIRGNRIQIHGTSTPDMCPKDRQSSLLSSRTKSFMEKFLFQSITFQQPTEQLAILRAHSSIVAFCENQRNMYLLAATKSNMQHLMQKLSQKKSVDNNPTNQLPAVASATQKPTSTLVIPPPLMNSTSTDVKTPTSDEIITESILLPTNTPAQIALFSDKTVENHLQIYFNNTFNIKLNIGLTKDSSKRIGEIVGRRSSVDAALKELLTLISLFRTEVFNEAADINWLNIPNSISVIQHQLNLRNIISVCQQQTSPISILVHHIDKEHDKLGVDEQIIETLCRKQLIVTTCKSIRFENEWTTLKTNILKRGDYDKSICLFEEQQMITLYGLSDVVKAVQQQFELINQRTIENPGRQIRRRSQSDLVGSCHTIPSDRSPTKNVPVKADRILKSGFQSNATRHCRIRQIPVGSNGFRIGSDRIHRPGKLRYVPPIVQIQPIKTEKLPVATPPEVRKPINPQKTIEIVTPKVQTHSIVFDIDEPGFEVVINQNFNRLLAIVDSKCSLSKQTFQHQIQIQIPKTKIYEFDGNTPDIEPQNNSSNEQASASPKTNWFWELFQTKKPDQTQSPQPVVNTTPSVTIGKSQIIVCTGDLKNRPVDLIVVCSTSKVLCDAITTAAGSEVESQYKRYISIGTLELETSGGNLPCKRIIFRPWVSHRQDLKQSIDTFVASIITYAVQCKLTTIAFPSIGCGQLGHDPKIIAEYMIGETYRQLKASLQSPMIVSFVLLPEQKNVYDAFANQLSLMTTIDDTPTSITFDKQTVRITLTGSDDQVLNECQSKIKTLARSCSCKLHLIDRIDMADWPQTAIQKYYEYCLQRRVIPTLDMNTLILDLIGPKDAVTEAEKYYFQLTTETIRNARIQIMSGGFVWLVEVSSGKWEQYPTKVIEQIETAHRKKLTHVDITNEKSERCQVIFSTMEEQYQQQKRAVRRKRIDSSLPTHWDLSAGGNFKRISLSSSSREYRDVLHQFDTTMRSQYSRIIQIERIQNERWYKQYAAHHEDFTRRHKHPDERLLFHGCSRTSADKIVLGCFNRTFAGVNGTLYGRGVYFHEHAKYSHSYTRPDLPSSERTMFLARVLIGKSCVGNSSMIVPPDGFDTTSDGKHIFVVYHDAAAYGEYLIIYK